MYEWMCAMLSAGKRRMKIVSSHKAEFKKDSQSGIYDSFVCQDCEDRFGFWDNYAATILRKQPIATAQAWDFGQYDYASLKRFFLSVLWRAHACERPFFEDVDLKHHAHTLAKCLLSDNSDTLKDFEVIPTWSDYPLSFGVLSPIQVPIETIPYWQLYLPRFQALIKVIDGPGAPCLQPWKMTPGKNLIMLEKDFTEFSEIDTVKQVAIENITKKNIKRRKKSQETH